MNIELEKEEILLLFLHLADQYESLDPPLQGFARKIEGIVYKNFTVSEIADVNGKEEGVP